MNHGVVATNRIALRARRTDNIRDAGNSNRIRKAEHFLDSMHANGRRDAVREQRALGSVHHARRRYRTHALPASRYGEEDRTIATLH